MGVQSQHRALLNGRVEKAEVWRNWLVGFERPVPSWRGMRFELEVEVAEQMMQQPQAWTRRRQLGYSPSTGEDYARP